jgi:hypothetical protein
MITNYNNGHWHPWNGGSIPVHPDSTVDVMFHDGHTSTDLYADEWNWDWDISTTIVAFKVTKEFKAEPREFWITNFLRYEVWNKKPDDTFGAIHVREVL